MALFPLVQTFGERINAALKDTSGLATKEREALRSHWRSADVSMQAVELLEGYEKARAAALARQGEGL